MNLIRYNPKAMDLLNVDRWFDDFLNTGFSGSSPLPAVDVRENEDSYLLEMELPGLSEKDVEVKLENSLLTISSHNGHSSQEKKDGYLLKERKSALFQRSFVLPDEVDREKISAEFTNGVLSMSFPKVPAAKPRTIEVKKA